MLQNPPRVLQQALEIVVINSYTSRESVKPNKTDRTDTMKLVDEQGNEITSKQNEEAQELEKKLSKKTEKLLEPIINKIKLSGKQIPQEQLIQLSSTAHQLLFNRLIYNLISELDYDVDDLLSDDDVEELQTSLKNQVRMVDPSEAAQQQQQDQGQDDDKS